MCSRAVNSFDLFVRGTDNAIYYRQRDTSGAWGSWTNLGGRLTSDPSAASYSSGSALFVCARGTDGAFWYRASGPSWTNWNTLGGRLLEGTGPAAFKQGDGVGLAVIGTNHQLYWRAPAWTSLGGYLTSSPGAASAGNTFVVDARGGDGALWSIYTANGGTSWVTWYSLGGRLLEGTGPAVYPSSSLATRMFVIGTNHELFWWHGTYTSLGGYLTSSPAAAAIPFQIVFARGADGALWGKEYFNGWQSWYSLGGQIAPGTGPAVCAIGGHADVFVKGVGGALWHTSKYYGGGSWSAWNSPGWYLTSSPAAATTNIGTIDVLVRGGNGDLWWGNYFAFLWSGWTDVGSTP